MPQQRPWSRDELILALNLYCKLPFGRFTRGTPEIIELARALGRTPSSISMRLCNFASYDPALRARGVKGLANNSKGCSQIWNEFSTRWDVLAVESERLMERLAPALTTSQMDQRDHSTPAFEPFAGPTQKPAAGIARVAQSFFRRAVLCSYQNRCCITGNPIPSLLAASHIVPWSVSADLRANPANGLCFAHTHHAAFDQGLITFDEEHRLVLSRKLRDYLPNDALQVDFVRLEGTPLRLPERFTPATEFLAHHRENVFERSTKLCPRGE